MKSDYFIRIYLDWFLVLRLSYIFHKTQIKGDFAETFKISKLKCDFTQISIHEKCDTSMNQISF